MTTKRIALSFLSLVLLLSTAACGRNAELDDSLRRLNQELNKTADSLDDLNKSMKRALDDAEAKRKRQ